MSEKKTDRRVAKTRKALCDALAELLCEKELHKITVQEIADKADVNRVTFYKHYLDVYDLYDKTESEVLVELGLLTLKLEELPPQDFFRAFIDYIFDNRNIFRMIFSPNNSGQLRSKLGKMIEGIFRQVESEKHSADIRDKELEYTSIYRVQGCLAVISKWVMSDFKDERGYIVEIISKLDKNMPK
ncbi:MAG TPA: hypothetical protein DCO93_05610 [Clostridiales bacterium]|nr:hypothetical protein [Clostridiales bacterium]